MPKRSSSRRPTRKDIILFVSNVPEDVVASLSALKKMLGFKVYSAMMYDSRKPKTAEKQVKAHIDILIPVDFESTSKITRALMPYKDRLLAITCRGEYHVAQFRKVIPHVPYLRTPTVDSLAWSTNKLEMRKRFYAYDKTITPKFAIVDNAHASSIKKILSRVSFPLVMKPTGLAASLLVTLCYHEDELEKALRTAFRKIRRLYKEQGNPEEPRVLVEEFMEGDMYSIDSYVTSRGRVFHCPIVHIKTGYAAGKGDFFGYIRVTPTALSAASIKKAEEVAHKTVHALGLRSTTAHIELMRTEKGWRVIECGPRIGGNRVRMYELSYGFNHSLNDILIRIPKKPILARKPLGYTAVIEFFPEKEGVITKIKGVKKALELKSIKDLNQRKKVGERARFARHGGKAILNVVLFHKDRSALLADVRRLEQLISIETKKGV
ncbi:ATP-grasp domain-containing protein [Candidatus Uhrbacteria bacterium]|nr:ATP-grasp domain-containing protein [Candidatus Uhrbacteria bacterium]